MTIAEGIAVALALAYLLLAVRQNPWCWACAIASSAIYLVLFMRAGLPMQSALQAFYVAMAGYGWVAWRRGGAEGSVLPISRWPLSRHLWALALVAILTMVVGRPAARYGSAQPYVDTLVAASSVLATWMVTRKVLENWLYWIVIDSVAAVLYWTQGLQATAGLFVIYVLIAVRGHFTWVRDYRSTRTVLPAAANG